jgi:hypothetical protein
MDSSQTTEMQFITPVVPVHETEFYTKAAKVAMPRNAAPTACFVSVRQTPRDQTKRHPVAGVADPGPTGEAGANSPEAIEPTTHAQSRSLNFVVRSDNFVPDTCESPAWSCEL